jgi:pyruvate dehydrogenase E1 component alpha subunit
MTPKPHLDRAHCRHLLGQMIRIRAFEDKCAELYVQQKIRGFLHLYNGEEANAVGLMQALSPQDSVVATYREHGHALARGIAMGPLMAEMYGKANGSSHGRGGSMHIFDRASRFYGGNAIVGGGLPLAVGLGLAAKMQKGPGVAVCLFGEGAVAEGEFHESLNLAALWKLPVLFVCENNLYAMGSAIERTESQTDIHLKAAAYRIASHRVDGMDVVAVEATTRAALQSIRAGAGPQFLECMTYRFRPHSMFDAQLYRDKAEIEHWKERDPIKRFGEWAVSSGLLHKDDVTSFEKDAATEVEKAVAFAEEGVWEPVGDLTKYVLMDKVPS